MRIDVKKYLFFGMSSSKVDFFKAAQEAGLVEFINPHSRGERETPHELQQLHNTLKILKKHVRKRI